MDVSEVKEKTSIATKWSTVTELLARCIGPITNMILARLLTPEAFGVVATVTMIVSFADIFTDAGFQKYLVQHDFKNEDELNQNTNVAFWTNLTLSVVIWGIICVFSDILASLVGNPGLGNVVVIASISIPLTSFSSIQMARYKRDFEYKTLFFVRIITSCLPLVVTIPLAFITRSYWALVIGSLVSNAVSAVILTICSKWKPKFYYNFRQLKEMFSYSWWILLESISVWLTSYIGTFIVGMFLSTYYVGLYKTSMSTVNQIISLITASTSMPLFAAMSRLKDNDNEMQKTYCDYLQAIGVFVIPLGVGMFLYSDLLTLILLGEQWLEASRFVGLWGLTSAVSLIFGTYCNGYFNAKGKTYLSFLSQILHLVVLVPVLLWSAQKGFQVLYISRSLVRLEFVAVQLLLMGICMKFKISKLVKKIIPIVVCTFIMGIVAIVLQQFGEAIWWQIVSILICILVYLISMLILSRKSLYDAIKIFGFKSNKK